MSKASVIILASVLICLLTGLAAADVDTRVNDARISVSSGSAEISSSVGFVKLTTEIDGETFVPSNTEKSSGKVKYSSNEKMLMVFPDPEIKQVYEITSTGVKDTVTLKTPHTLTYNIVIEPEATLSHQSDGTVWITNPSKPDGYIEISRPIGTDANGQSVTFDYDIQKTKLRVKIPEVGDSGKILEYPLEIDPHVTTKYYLKLLIHGNLESPALSTSDFRDSSREFQMPKAGVAPVGGIVNTNSTQAKYGNASIFINNPSPSPSAFSNITVPDDNGYTFGLNNHSISMWVYWPIAPTRTTLYDHRTDGSNYDQIELATTTSLVYNRYRGGGTIGSISATVPAMVAGKWYQIALIQNGTTADLYVNGTSYGSAARTASMTDLTGPVVLSQSPNGAGAQAQFMDEVIITNGGFAPTIAELQGEYPLYLNGTFGGYADDNSTVSLLHFDGANGGTFFRDQYGNRTWVVAGSATTSTNTYKFGQSSYYSGATAANYLYSNTPTSEFNYGTGDYTIDLWLNKSPNIVPGEFEVMYGRAITGNVTDYEQLYLSTVLAYGYFTGGTIRAIYSTPYTDALYPTGVWRHIAFVRNGSSGKFYVNGNYVTTTATTAFNGNLNMPSTASLFIGTHPVYPTGANFTGRIDELRVTKGLARWTANFTPPTTPYELITNQTWTPTPDASGSIPVTIQFTDGTPSSAWTNNTYLWDFGDGGTSTLANPSHVYSTTGMFNVSSTVMNNNMSTTYYKVVPIGAPDVEYACTPLTGTAALTVTCTDLTTNTTPITSYLLDYGDGVTTTDAPNAAGQWVHVYATYGSFSPNLTVTNSIGSDYEYKRDYIVVSTEQNEPTTYYSPHQVTITVKDHMGISLDGATVTAIYNESTFSNALYYLMNAYGYEEGLARDMLSTNTTMMGTTGTDGSLVFTMHPSLQYNITAMGGGNTISALVYPSDTSYTIWLPENNPSNIYEEVNVSLTFGEPNISFFTLGTNFQDTAGLTSSLLFYVNATNGTPIYQTTAIPGTSNITINQTIRNIRGESFYWGVRGTRTGGNVSLDQGVTSKGPNGVLVDLGIPTTPVNYYPWIGLFLLFLITGIASKNNIRFMAILVPVMGAIFMWFGWLTGAYLGAVIPFTAVLGIIYYMKGSLRENYGIGGPGSLLLTIIVFLVMFQMMVGFVNSLGVFQQNIILPDNGFSNIGLTDVKTGADKFVGINDPLQSGAEYAALGWTVIRTTLIMFSAALLIAPFLIEMFPYIQPAFFAILQGCIYLLYVFFVMKLIAHSGPVSDY